MFCQELENYIEHIKPESEKPFFYILGDEQYSNIWNQLLLQGFSTLRVSDFCSKVSDRVPDLDNLIYNLKTLDTDCRTNKYVLLGLGEFLALKGTEYSKSTLSQFKNVPLGNAKVIILLRGIAHIANKVLEEDVRLVEQGRYFSEEHLSYQFTITVTPPYLQKSSSHPAPFRALLQTMEEGIEKQIESCTTLISGDCLLQVQFITCAYDVLRLQQQNFPFKKTDGSDVQWQWLLEKTKNGEIAIQTLFKKIAENFSIDNIHDYLNIRNNECWFCYLYLKIQNNFKNTYLQFVLQQTDSFDEFVNNFLSVFVSVSHEDPNFWALYEDRKKLMRNFTNSEISSFLAQNERNPDEVFFHLTDTSELERKTIVQWFSNHHLTPEIKESLKKIYPDLYSYLQDFSFDGNPSSNELQEYFGTYKRLKLQNKITEEFENLVLSHFQNLTYAPLQTRNNILMRIAKKDPCYLLWIDALGVEYISFIKQYLESNDVYVDIAVARADLPTITSKNKDFYDNWQGDKHKESRLDEIKHKNTNDSYEDSFETSVYLVQELDVIKNALDQLISFLNRGKYASIVIVSDHGASRLAVLKNQEIKYESDTPGEHSGRCCKTFPNWDIEHAIEENGYIVLSDYGRFRKSRKANIEVHGGATLEEVLIPIITLTLKDGSKLVIELDSSNKYLIDRHTGITLKFYVSFLNPQYPVTLKFQDKEYFATKIDSTHISFTIPEIKKAKTYTVSVFEKNKHLKDFTFTAKSKGMEQTDYFDFN